MNKNILQIFEYICRNSMCRTCVFRDTNELDRWVESCLLERIAKVSPSGSWQFKYYISQESWEVDNVLINRMIFEVGI